jgi:hypothetical protein
LTAESSIFFELLDPVIKSQDDNAETFLILLINTICKYILSQVNINTIFIILAEGVGFEPTELSLNGFQDRHLKPLGHPSIFLAEGIK